MSDFDYGQLINLGMGMMQQQRQNEREQYQRAMEAENLRLANNADIRAQKSAELQGEVQKLTAKTQELQLLQKMIQIGANEKQIKEAMPNVNAGMVQVLIDAHQKEEQAKQNYLLQNPHAAQYVQAEKMYGKDVADKFHSPKNREELKTSALQFYTQIALTQGKEKAKKLTHNWFGKEVTDTVAEIYPAHLQILNRAATAQGQDGNIDTLLVVNNGTNQDVFNAAKVGWENMQKTKAKLEEMKQEQEYKVANAEIAQKNKKEMVDYNESTPSQQWQNAKIASDISYWNPQLLGGKVLSSGDSWLPENTIQGLNQMITPLVPGLKSATSIHGIQPPPGSTVTGLSQQNNVAIPALTAPPVQIPQGQSQQIIDPEIIKKAPILFGR